MYAWAYSFRTLVTICVARTHSRLNNGNGKYWLRYSTAFSLTSSFVLRPFYLPCIVLLLTFHLNAYSHICISLAFIPFKHPFHPLSSSWMDIMKNAGISTVEQITNSMQNDSVVPRWSKTFKWFWWTVCICWKETKLVLLYYTYMYIFVDGWMTDWLTD